MKLYVILYVIQPLSEGGVICEEREPGAVDRVRLRSGEFRLLEFISSTDGWPWLILERSRVSRFFSLASRRVL